MRAVTDCPVSQTMITHSVIEGGEGKVPVQRSLVQCGAVVRSECTSKEGGIGIVILKERFEKTVSLSTIQNFSAKIN